MDEFENWEGEEPFGEMAVQLGFCTAKDVREALNKQHRLQEEEEEEEKLIGVILMEEGLLTSEQVISILRMLEHRNGAEAPSEPTS